MLYSLKVLGEGSAKQLAREAGVRFDTAYRILRRLEEAGLVERRPSFDEETQRPVWAWKLTTRGKAVANHAGTIIRASEEARQIIF